MIAAPRRRHVTAKAALLASALIAFGVFGASPAEANGQQPLTLDATNSTFGQFSVGAMVLSGDSLAVGSIGTTLSG